MIWIKVILFILLIVFLCYLDIRNHFVYKYREEKKESGTDEELSSYIRMLFSFKPLKDKYWLNK